MCLCALAGQFEGITLSQLSSLLFDKHVPKGLSFIVRVTDHLTFLYQLKAKVGKAWLRWSVRVAKSSAAHRG